MLKKTGTKRRAFRAAFAGLGMLLGAGGVGSFLAASPAGADPVYIYGNSAYGNNGYTQGHYSDTNAWWGDFTPGCNGAGNSWNDCMSSMTDGLSQTTWLWEDVDCQGNYIGVIGGGYIYDGASSYFTGTTVTVNDKVSADNVGSAGYCG